MRRAINAKFKVLLVVVFCFFSAAVPVREAEAFAKTIHESVTRGKLNFLKSDVLNLVVAGNLEQDAVIGGVFKEIHHFDNCAFLESSNYIIQSYDRALPAADPDHFDNATLTKEFGHITHSAQDFYAHSSWVDTGQADLVNKTYTNWDPLRPFSIINNAMIIEGEQSDIDAQHWSWIKGSPRYNYRIRTGSGTYPIVISGWFFWGGDHCPDRVAMPHYGWQSAIFFWNPFWWSSGLHKDHAGRLNFTQARQLAEKQTLHEFCRLVHLVHGRYGSRGVLNLFTQWFPNMPSAAQFQNLCSASSGITWIQPPPPPVTPPSHGGIAIDPNAQALLQSGRMTIREMFFAVDDLPKVLGGDGQCQLIKIQDAPPATGSDLRWVPACRGSCSTGSCPDIPRTVPAGHDANGQDLFKWKCSCQ